MDVLEKILEEMLNYERVVKTDEDLEWNRAMYKCSEIIRSHMVEKEKVSSAEIISRNIDGKPYYEIKYQKVGECHYTVGYSSYKLNFVVEWLNKYFEFCGEVKVSVVDDKDTNIHDNDEIEPVSEEFLKDCAETAARYKRNFGNWISVEERLPKETEKEYYPVMYVTTSYGVVAWGFYRVKDEQWYLYNDIMEEFESVENNKIIAWQPLPEPYKPKKNIPVEGMDHIMRRFTKVE